MDISEESSVLFPMVNRSKKNEGTQNRFLILGDRINILTLNQDKQLLKRCAKKPLKSPDFNFTAVEA